MIKSRRVRWEGHAARMGRGEERRIQDFVGKPEGKKPLGRPRRRWIIFRWIFRKWDVGAWTGSSWLRIGTGGGHV